MANIHTFNSGRSYGTSSVGTRYGPQRTYYDNGKKKTEATYDNNELHGKFIKYRITGNKETEIQYIHGKINGSYIDYDKNGVKIMESYYKNNKKDGYEFIYGYDTITKNGKKEYNTYRKTLIVYRNNVKNGKYFEYYKDGNKKYECNHVNDLVSGMCIAYRKNRSISSRIIIEKDKIITGSFYYKNGYNRSKFYKNKLKFFY